MAVDTPVLDRITVETERKYSVPSRMDLMAEEEHNARIKDTYARLINPENKIEDVFNRAEKQVEEPVEQCVMQFTPAQVRPYYVENARTNAAIFRADSAINSKREQVVDFSVAEVAVDAPATEEESEDLRPTPATIQYQTINRIDTKKSTESKRGFSIGKREKIIVAIFVAVVVALITLVIVNATIITNLNAEVAQVQNNIATVRGAISGVNSSVSGMIDEIMNNGLNH